MTIAGVSDLSKTFIVFSEAIGGAVICYFQHCRASLCFLLGCLGHRVLITSLIVSRKRRLPL